MKSYIQSFVLYTQIHPKFHNFAMQTIIILQSFEPRASLYHLIADLQ